MLFFKCKVCYKRRQNILSELIVFILFFVLYVLFYVQHFVSAAAVFKGLYK